MPIAFACGCGKEFSVADEYSGKRTKCPACHNPLTVPTTESPAADEDEAFRVLAEGSESEEEAPAPARRDPLPAATTAPPPAPRPTPAPQPKRLHRTRSASESESRYQRPRIYISPGVMGGIGSMILGAVWFFLGLAADRIYIFAPVVFFMGLLAVIRGFLGHPED